MRFVTLIIAFASVVAASESLLQAYQLPLLHSQDLKVPGDNPLDYCSDPEDDILDIEYADLIPNEIKRGANVTIEIHGDLSEDVKNGSVILFDVLLKAGPSTIPVLSRKEDLCGLVDGGCPVEQGSAAITKNITIPDEVPPGTYIVRMNATNQNDDRITCVEAIVSF